MKRLLHQSTATILMLATASFVMAQTVGARGAGVARAGAGNNNQSRSNVSNQFKLPPAAVEQFTLKNGLRVVFNRDSAIPVVSVAVYYNTGSRNEKQGRTGFAHLFEHMMFQGSENVPKAAHFQFISNAGGDMNGNTTTERTAYFQTLPANQLPLALWLESDRMRSLAVTKENLDNQRKAVQEEKRMRFDNQAYLNGLLRINEMIFKNFSNAHPPIGSMEDLEAASAEDVAEFFRIYYAPNNAVLVISGDFVPAEARALVEKYFGTIPRQPDPPAPDVTEPPEVALRQDTYNDRFAQLPAFILGWKLPARRTQDFYALQLAGELLFKGESSRLYQKMVKGEESVLAIQGFFGERRGPSSMYIFTVPKPGKAPEQIQQTVLGEIKRLATDGPTAEEMEKLRNSLINDAVRGRQSSLFRAQQIAEYTLYDNDPNLFNTELDRYLAVSSEQIKQAVKRFLDTDNHSTLNIVPAGASAAPRASTPQQSQQPKPDTPPPTVPDKPKPTQPTQPTTPVQPGQTTGQPQQPTDTPKPQQSGTGRP
ncbi:MAG TPA: pitrilysin family protein [Pyrinomonadaceae bacterium]|nr:pitrilysin family protein [Pyrinomonadaceae bacterium]